MRSSLATRRYQRVRDKLTAEVFLPQLPDVEHGLTIVLERRMSLAGVQVSLPDILAPEGLQLLSQTYIESVTDGQAGDLRRTLAVMRAALDIALGDSMAQRITYGHVEEGMAKTPLVASSAF